MHAYPFESTVRAMAERCGVTREHLSAVLARKKRCSVDLAEKLFQFSNGRVNLLPAYHFRNHRQTSR